VGAGIESDFEKPTIILKERKETTFFPTLIPHHRSQRQLWEALFGHRMITSVEKAE
jgi:hypothetical protein